jgi:hypothetical protein
VLFKQGLSTPARVDVMQTPPRSTPRERTEAMVRNIALELREIEQAMTRCRGDGIAEARLTGSWLAHLLISSRELLGNLLIDTARRPRRVEQPRQGSSTQGPGT